MQKTLKNPTTSVNTNTKRQQDSHFIEGTILCSVSPTMQPPTYRTSNIGPPTYGPIYYMSSDSISPVAIVVIILGVIVFGLMLGLFYFMIIRPRLLKKSPQFELLQQEMTE